MAERKAFNFYKSYWEQMKLLNNKQKLDLFDAICQVQFLEINISDIKFNDKITELVWTGVKHSVSTSLNGFISKNKGLNKEVVAPLNKGGAQQVQEEGKEEEEGQLKPNNSIIEKLNSFDSEILSICKWFIEQMDETARVKISNKNKLAWCETIEKCNRIDGFTFERISEIVKSTKLDSFWNPNFMSLRKLREKKSGDDLTYIFRWDAKLKAPIIPQKETYEQIVSRTTINERQTF